MTNHWISYRWQKGMSRYYKVTVYKDLLNDWVLTCAWGGLNNRLGNYKHIVLKTFEDADLYIQELMKRRLKRGYKLSSSSGAP